MKKNFAVIGLGLFGLSLVEELAELGAEVLAVDIKEEAVNIANNYASYSAVCDTTNEKSLKDLGLQNIDHVVVAIGSNIQASILTTVILKDIGVKKLTVKVNNEYHARVVEKIGADEIISPEISAGKRLAHKIISNSIIDYYNITDEYDIINFTVSENFEPQTLISLDARNNYDVNIILISRDGNSFSPKATDEILPLDDIMVVGKAAKVAKFEHIINNK